MTYLAVVATVLCLTQGAPLDGSWELTRVFRSGPSAATRAVPLDSTVYVRLSLASHTGGWFTGALYRRYFGQPERFDHPVSMQAKTATWLVGDTLHLGTPFVPDADSIEFRRVRVDAPDPPTLREVVTRP